MVELMEWMFPAIVRLIHFKQSNREITAQRRNQIVVAAKLSPRRSEDQQRRSGRSLTHGIESQPRFGGDRNFGHGTLGYSPRMPETQF